MTLAHVGRLGGGRWWVVPRGSSGGGPLRARAPLQRGEPVADTVDNLAIAVERTNIFTAPETKRRGGADAQRPRPTGVFAAAQPSPGDQDATVRAATSGRRWSAAPALTVVAAGLSVRRAVCLAAIVSLVTAALVLHELGAGNEVGAARAVERHGTAVGTATRHKPTSPQRRANRTREQPASPRRRHAGRDSRAPRRARCCRRTGPRRRRSSHRSVERQTPSPQPIQAAPAAPAKPKPAPTAPGDGAAPEAVPAGAPPEFM